MGADWLNAMEDVGGRLVPAAREFADSPRPAPPAAGPSSIRWLAEQVEDFVDRDTDGSLDDRFVDRSGDDRGHPRLGSGPDHVHHGRLRGFLADMEKLGHQLDNCQDSYEKALNKLSQGRGNLISQAARFPDLGVKVKEELSTLTADTSK